MFLLSNWSEIVFLKIVYDSYLLSPSPHPSGFLGTLCHLTLSFTFALVCHQPDLTLLMAHPHTASYAPDKDYNHL